MEETFLKLMFEHQRIIMKVAKMYRDKREDQEDLFQEILLQLWRSFPSFRNESKISTWIYRIALNTAMATFRQKKVKLIYHEPYPEKLHPRESDTVSEHEEKLYEALRKLDTGERAIISLYLEDYTYQEIAEIIGISENYVGVRINRIRNKLKALISDK